VTDLVVIVPSRGRPHAVAELLDAFRDTCTAETQVVVAVDDNDPMLPKYPYANTCLVPKATNMVRALNFAAAGIVGGREATPTEMAWAGEVPFAVGFMGDDHRPRTVGWDQRYLDRLHRLKTGMVYGNDLLQCERLPTQVAMTSDIIRALGYMAPEQLSHLYVDNAWLALGTELGRISYLPDVVIEHLHPIAAKGEWDEGYERVNNATAYARDRAVFGQWLRLQLPNDVQRIRQVMA
jgi:hypothetical protein